MGRWPPDTAGAAAGGDGEAEADVAGARPPKRRRGVSVGRAAAASDAGAGPGAGSAGPRHGSREAVASGGEGGAEEPSHPKLGRGLRTFVINLRRRTDRREHIERLCHTLELDYEIMAAVDGRDLAGRPGASLEVAEVVGAKPAKRKSAPTPPSPSPPSAAEAQRPPRRRQQLPSPRHRAAGAASASATT